ncbi:MAG: SDR family oxidoreductase [Phycisphaerae bacterium]|nr:SDR family oxidoreductase [Phycisphaerae bacterium]
MAINKTLVEIIEMSKRTGSDSKLVQGGGGNTSAKTPDGKYMYIKASGTPLKDMSPAQGWRRMDLKAVRDIVADKSIVKLDVFSREDVVVKRLNLACDDDMPVHSRPSVEAHLHSLLDTHVIHLHPQAVGAYVNAKEGQVQVEKLFKAEKYPPLWVPYVDPGITLAHTVERLINGYQKTYSHKPAIIFMEKHGLFVTASTAKATVNLVRKVIRLCDSQLKTASNVKIKAADPVEINSARLAIRRAIFKTTGQYLSVSDYQNDTIADFAKRKDAKKLLAGGPLTPDEIVYANGAPMWLDKYDGEALCKKLQKQIDKGDKPSASFVIQGLGLFVAAEVRNQNTIYEVGTCSLFIRSNAARMGGVATLTARQREFINKWEAESYRQAISGAGTGGLKDRIAVVSGGGSGIGRGIAIGLARAGAMVAVSDIDTRAADETVAIIKEELPAANAITVQCNVTDENSVDQSFENLLNSWGGLDILVNAAGVAPAFPLTDFPVDKWRFALEVNLTGYFLMARAAARTMIAQGMGGALINISSKSGIDASKDNSAYNATKAGELHLTRGWAMELGEHDIRVNSVCPGNVFEGSKIWNPEYMKVCARKYGIKPDEVIPHYVNKTILKKEIFRQVIADAVVFLASDQSRCITAQTIVADPGQAVVR